MVFQKSIANQKTFCSSNLFYLAAFAFVVACLPTTTTTLPLTDVVAEAMLVAKGEKEGHRERREAIECARPSNLEEMFQQLNAETSETKFYRPTIANSQAVTTPEGEIGRFTENPNENKSCPNQLTVLDTAPLAHRSLCPFYFDILQMPAGYYPSSFFYAKCKCTDCVENSSFGCEPVSTNVVVLKPNGCSNGLQLYKETTINVHTSCACAFRGKRQDEALPYSTILFDGHENM